LTYFSIIFGSLLCTFIRDVKILVAYSSIVHMGFLLLVVLQRSAACKTSGLFLIVSHGLVSSVLFYLVGEIYSVFQTRLLYFLVGLRSSSFLVSQVVLIYFLINSGAPFTLGFFGEVLGLGVVYCLTPWVIIFLFMYFLLSFYYNI
jgi:NADH-quinone oxidoreductase subunit M